MAGRCPTAQRAGSGGHAGLNGSRSRASLPMLDVRTGAMTTMTKHDDHEDHQHRTKLTRPAFAQDTIRTYCLRSNLGASFLNASLWRAMAAENSEVSA